MRPAFICVCHCSLDGGVVTIHHAGSHVASHLVTLFSILSYRITLYDYQAMCRANKDSSDGASGLLDVSTVHSPTTQAHVSICF